MVRRPAPLTAALAALLAVTLLGGCTRDSSSSSSGAAAAPAAASGAPGAAAVQLPVARDVVRTASLAVRVPAVRPAADRARAAAETDGGSLQSEDDRSGSGGEDVLRLRVPPARLSPVLDALAGLGRETARSVGSEDVTGRVVDLQSRLATQRASVDRVRRCSARRG